MPRLAELAESLAKESAKRIDAVEARKKRIADYSQSYLLPD